MRTEPAGILPPEPHDQREVEGRGGVSSERDDQVLLPAGGLRPGYSIDRPHPRVRQYLRAPRFRVEEMLKVNGGCSVIPASHLTPPR